MPPAITISTGASNTWDGCRYRRSSFRPNRTVTRGVRPNAAFESLTLTPDERHLFTATETALVQDGEPADERGARGRILEYEASGDLFEPRREFAYPLDPLAKPGFTPGVFINGLVELLALGERAALVERA